MGETVGRMRARRNSLFTQTIIWVTALVCVAFLLGTLAQAWSNSQLSQQVQAAQRQLDQVKSHHRTLVQANKHYQDPSVIENEARQQLGYTRPGEHPVVVVGTNDSQHQGTQKRASTQTKQDFWQDWWNAFFSS
jgi:cell division protein FtsB